MRDCQSLSHIKWECKYLIVPLSFPKSEIDFIEISVSCYCTAKKQFRDQKLMSVLIHCSSSFIFMTMSHPQHIF